MTNPVIAEVTRGDIIESRHRGAYAVVDRAGHVVAAEGGIAAAVYPRSAIKAFQCLPVIESGAADHFGFTDEEIALCCSSHNGEPDHVRVARAMLAKGGNAEDLYECGAHWPYFEEARFDLVRHSQPCAPDKEAAQHLPQSGWGGLDRFGVRALRKLGGRGHGGGVPL